MGVRSTNNPLTAREASDNANNYFGDYYSTDKLLADTLEIIESHSKSGLTNCTPFHTEFEIIRMFGAPKHLTSYKQSVISTIEQLEQLGYSVHIPKKLLTRKPKYEYTVISW